MEVSETLINRESGRKRVELPTIQYAKDLSSVPYVLEVDPAQMRDVLLDSGISPEDVRKTTIKILRKPPFSVRDHASLDTDVLGKYDSGSRTIEIYADNIWNIHQEVYSICEGVLDGSKDPKVIERFRQDGFLVTRRLPEYLSKASPERAKKFLRKLILIGFERGLKKTLIHESSHRSFDTTRSDKRIKRLVGNLISVAFPSGLGVYPTIMFWQKLLEGGQPLEIAGYFVSSVFLMGLGHQLAYRLSPEERQSRKLEEKFTSYPGLIKVAPR